MATMAMKGKGEVRLRERFISSNQWFTLSAILFIFILFVWPFVRLIWMSVTADGSLTLAHFSQIFQDAQFWKMFRRTLWIVVWATLGALLLGFVYAYVIAYTDVRGKKVMQLLLMMPFIVPSYILTIGWTQFAQLFQINLYSIGGIIFVLMISHFPLVFLFTLTMLQRIPLELEQAVRVSGGNQWTVLKQVTFPLALPGLVGGGLLAFLTNLDNFGIPAFLGIPAHITVLSTAIYQEVVGFGPGAFSRAAALSAILAVIALIGYTLQNLILKNKQHISETAPVVTTPRIPLGKKKIYVELILWSSVLLLTIVPLLVLVKTSVIKVYGLPFRFENLTLSHYQFLLQDTDKVWNSLQTSGMFAVITVALTIIIGTALAYVRSRSNTLTSRWMEGMITIPYALPGIVLALSMILAWMEPLPGWNPNIYGTGKILILAYFTRFLILQVKGSAVAFAQVSVDLEEAAQVSGASPFAKWKEILWPLVATGVSVGALFVALTTFTELTVSSLLWSSGTETVGVMIFNYEQAGYTTYSTAFSVIVLSLMASVALFVGLLLRMKNKKRGGMIR